MPKILKTVHVSFLNGEFGRATVESWSKAGEHHMVDLTEYQPLGRCSCADWQCRRFPEWKKTLKPVRCRHLTAAREALLNRIIREAAPV